MKIVRCLAVIGFLILASSVALADSVGDPKFQVVGGSGSTLLTTENIATAFVINYSGGQTNPPIVSVPCGDSTCFQTQYDFLNATGQTFTAIQFEIKSVGGNINNVLLDGSNGGFAVGDNSNDPYFLFSTAFVNAAGDVVLSFFGTNETHPGILSAPLVCPEEGDCYYSDAPAYDFGVLVDVTGSELAGNSFFAQGTVPEPRSIVLLLAGAALLGLYLSKRPA